MIPECPRCHHRNGIPLSDGTRLCFDCQNEWDADAIPADELVLSAILGYGTLRDYFEGESFAGRIVPARPAAGSPAGADDTQSPIPAPAGDPLLSLKLQLVGKRVSWGEGEGAGIIVTLDDEGDAMVSGDDGVQYTLDPDVLTMIDDVNALVEMDDETAESANDKVRVMMGAVLQASVARLPPNGSDIPILPNPAGWLIDDPLTWALAEEGITVAFVWLVQEFGLDHDDVRKRAAALLGMNEHNFENGDL